MALPDSYTLKPVAIPQYFDSVLRAEAPERFSSKFLDNLDFKSTNDRPFIGILKDLKFLDADAVPTKRYYEFLDRSQSKRVVATAIQEAYADLFAINKEAHKLSLQEVKNKLRTLFAGSKKDALVGRIARTFTALCEYADFTPGPNPQVPTKERKDESPKQSLTHPPQPVTSLPSQKSVSLASLQYHINIVLPESRDQAIYDAIFKSLREHLG